MIFNNIHIKQIVVALICAMLFPFASYAQWQVVTAGSANNFIISNYPANFSDYTPGLTITFKANHTITGPTTLTVNGLAPIALKKKVNTDLEAGDIMAGQFVTVTFDASGYVFQIMSEINPGSSGGSTGWSLTGNSGTIPTTNFIGTSDSQPLLFKVNNERSGIIDYDINKINTSLGYRSLFSNSGNYNSAFGGNSLFSNTTGQGNTAVGVNALYLNSTASNNTAVGATVLFSNTTGEYNSALGSGALSSNSIGNNNTALGANSLLANTEGSGNTAVGVDALSLNTTGYDNTALGVSALYSNTGTHNTATGSYALRSNTIGTGNTASGTMALERNTEGSDNTAIGYVTLSNNTTGNENSAYGAYSLNNNVTGIKNSAFGNYSLFSNTTGNYNTAVGLSLGNNMTGSYNTAIGYGADVLVDGLTNATMIGFNAKAGISNSMILGGTGADAVYVGIGTSSPLTNLQINDPSNSVTTSMVTNDASSLTLAFGTTANNYLGAIRYNNNVNSMEFWTANTQRMFLDGSGNLGLGMNPSGSYMLEVNGRLKSAGINETSDARWKKNIETIDSSLYKVLNLRGVTYNWNPETFKDTSDKSLQIGLIAQEVEKVLPQLVNTDKDGFKSVQYSKLVAVLVEALKEQQKIIDDQKNGLGSLQMQNDVMKNDVKEMKAMIETLMKRSGIEIDQKEAKK